MASRLTSSSWRALGTPGILERLEGHAMACFPKESCALLLEGADGPAVELTDNQLDRAHVADPETFPRTAERGFLVDARRLDAAEARGDRVLAIVHSHVRVGAYFSDEDRAWATAPWGGPLLPGVDHVVLDAQGEGVRGLRVFAWSDGVEDFVEVPAP